MEASLNFLEKLKHKWEKLIGLFLTILASLFIYSTFIVDRLNELIGLKLYVTYLIIPISFIILIVCYWLVNTNRISLFKSNKLTVGIFIKIDDDESEIKIKKIVKEIIKDINSNFENIILKLYPINKVKTRKELEKYYAKKSTVLDAMILAKIESGNRNDENQVQEVIEVVDIVFQGNFDVNTNLTFFKTSVNISKDVKIRNINKNWAYIESNSLSDKKKIKNNFNDAIIFYCGLYLIYQNKPEKAIEILKTLHNKNDTIAAINHKEKKIIANENFISASRLNEILLNLFVLNSTRSYKNKETKKAYDALKECEKIFGVHPQSYEHYISLARFSYELGSLLEAQSYTEKAKNIKHYGTEIYLNEGFFAILNNDDDSLYKNYKELSKVYKHEKSNVNFTEIASWIENEKNIYKKNNSLFEFAIGTLNLFYSDKKLGKQILLKIHKEELKKEYPLIYKLTSTFLTKGETKSAFYKKSGKKKRKRKK